jgi:hypothetical protein
MGKPEEKKPKLPRDRELTYQLVAMEAQLKKDIDAVVKDVATKQRKALVDSTQKSGVNGKATAEHVAQLRESRDRLKKLAQQEYEHALRAAQSERDKAIRAADISFDAAQLAAEAELVEMNRPIEEQYRLTDAALVREANEKLTLLKTAYEESTKPLADELKALEEAKAERRARAEQRPHGPA